MGVGQPFGISRTKRLVVPAAEHELFTTHTLEDGSIELVDYMGGDEMVGRVATAGHGPRICKENPTLDDLILYLGQHGITHPFHFVQLKVNILAPIEAALSLVYLAEASVNEYSGRYSKMLDTARLPSVHRIASLLNSKDKEHMNNAIKIHAILKEVRKTAVDDYETMLGVDFARELARTGLGTDNHTKFFLKIDLPGLAKFYTAQQKFQNPFILPYANRLAAIAGAVAPASFSALTDKSIRRNKLTMPSDDAFVGPLQPAAWQPRLTKRVTVRGIETLLFSEQPLLKDSGIQAIDYMGDDYCLAQAARVSYGQDTKQLSDDITLIRSLVRDEHTSPIEMAELAVEARVPVFTDPRQAGRHRTLPWHGSMGVVPLAGSFYMPDDSQFKYQDRKNRQGRGKDMEPEDKKIVYDALVHTRDAEARAVQELRELGAPEILVRSVKGVGHHTMVTRTGDALNWARFFKLRSDSHAQYEVQEYSKAVEKIYQAQLPETYKAVRTFMLDAIKLSTREQAFMRQGFETLDDARAALLLTKEFSQYRDKDDLKSRHKRDSMLGRALNREGETFLAKLKNIYAVTSNPEQLSFFP